jgi:hypothetical protein
MRIVDTRLWSPKEKDILRINADKRIKELMLLAFHREVGTQGTPAKEYYLWQAKYRDEEKFGPKE